MLFKQTAKKEIWVTSPVSGPTDYHFDDKEKKFKSNLGILDDVIPKEIKQLCSVDI